MTPRRSPLTSTPLLPLPLARYDSQRAVNPASDAAAFARMMSCLAAQGDRGAGSEGGGESGFPEYLVAVRATHDHQHSCSRPDCAVRLSAALSLPHSSSLPPSYVCLDSSQLGELRRAYCRLHCQRPTIPPAARLLQHPPPTLGPPLPTTCKEVVFPDRASLEAAAAAARMAGASAAARAAAGAADAAAPSDVARLLGALQQVVSTAGGGGHAEWERGLHVLAAALSQHCRTRSADEVLAFMRNEESSAPKRLQVESQQPQPAAAPPAWRRRRQPPSLAEVQHGIFDLAGPGSASAAAAAAGSRRRVRLRRTRFTSMAIRSRWCVMTARRRVRTPATAATSLLATTPTRSPPASSTRTLSTRAAAGRARARDCRVGGRDGEKEQRWFDKSKLFRVCVFMEKCGTNVPVGGWHENVGDPCEKAGRRSGGG